MPRFDIEPAIGLLDHQAADYGNDLAEGSKLFSAILSALATEGARPVSLSPAKGGGISRGPGLLLRGFGAAASTGYAFKVWGLNTEWAQRDAAQPASAHLTLVASATVTTGSTVEPANSLAAGLYPHASIGTVTVGTSFANIAANNTIDDPYKTTSGLLICPDLGLFDQVIIESATGLKWACARFG